MVCRFGAKFSNKRVFEMTAQPSQQVETPSQIDQGRVGQSAEPSLISHTIASGGHGRRQLGQNTTALGTETQ